MSANNSNSHATTPNTGAGVLPRTVLVLKGGPDAEREVSLKSGAMVAAALRRAGMDVNEVTIDRPGLEELRGMRGEVVFPVLHGSWGEGGPLQELLEADGRPYVGCGPKAACLAMDKIASKALVAEFRVPTPRSQELRTGVEFSLDFPVVLKPADDGSSVDLRICYNMQEVMRARLEIGPRRERILAEEFITGRELTVGLIDGECLPIIEIRPRDGTYDYEAKYNRDDTQYILDPELPVGVADAVRAFSRAAWHAVGCRDVARVDFMLDERGPWFLEINTMPGFTDHSLVPKAATHAGISMEELVSGLVRRALNRACARRVAA
ncbi:MAG: D-alanine--D-alanine ligase [Planctomycetota bacterium]|nr:D-alanine--D-alanine ligase [Planctomycetota bacterium]